MLRSNLLLDMGHHLNSLGEERTENSDLVLDQTQDLKNIQQSKKKNSKHPRKNFLQNSNPQNDTQTAAELGPTQPKLISSYFRLSKYLPCAISEFFHA